MRGGVGLWTPRNLRIGFRMSDIMHGDLDAVEHWPRSFNVKAGSSRPLDEQSF